MRKNNKTNPIFKNINKMIYKINNNINKITYSTIQKIFKIQENISYIKIVFQEKAVSAQFIKDSPTNQREKCMPSKKQP